MIKKRFKYLLTCNLFSVGSISATSPIICQIASLIFQLKVSKLIIKYLSLTYNHKLSVEDNSVTFDRKQSEIDNLIATSIVQFVGHPVYVVCYL